MVFVKISNPFTLSTYHGKTLWGVNNDEKFMTGFSFLNYSVVVRQKFYFEIQTKK